MLLILDEHISKSISDFFVQHGFEVQFVQELFTRGEVDPVIAALADRMEAMIVSQDADFKRIAPRIPKGNVARFRRLSRLSLTCKAPQAVNRLERYIDHIKLEIQQAQGRHDRRVIIELGDRIFRIVG